MTPVPFKFNTSAPNTELYRSADPPESHNTMVMCGVVWNKRVFLDLKSRSKCACFLDNDKGLSFRKRRNLFFFLASLFCFKSIIKAKCLRCNISCSANKNGNKIKYRNLSLSTVLLPNFIGFSKCGSETDRQLAHSLVKDHSVKILYFLFLFVLFCRTFTKALFSTHVKFWISREILT